MNIRRLLAETWPEWELGDRIGSGSYGRVYRIEKENHGHFYYAALKVIEIPSEPSETESLKQSGMGALSIRDYYEETAKSLKNEIDIMQILKSSANIVTIEDSAIIKKKDNIGWIMLIRMELLDNLSKYKQKQTMTIGQCVKLGMDICSAISDCEKEGIIHRDIKPENVFANEFGTFKLGDFGIARKLEKSKATMSKKGTELFMAPEVIKGQRYDSTVDIYSLGIMLYRFLNKGRMPFYPPYPEKITPTSVEEALLKKNSGEAFSKPLFADDELGRIILKACAYRPEERYQKASEMKSDLMNWMLTRNEEELSIDPNPAIEDATETQDHISTDTYDDTPTIEDTFDPPPVPPKKNIFIIAAVIVLLIAAFGAGIMLFSGRNNTVDTAAYQQLLREAGQTDGDEAVELYRQAQELNPKDPEAYEGEFRILYESGNNETLINRAAELEKEGRISVTNNSNVYMMVASSYFELAEYENAAEIYKALDENSEINDFDIKLNYAAAVGRTGDLKTAQRIIDELRISSDNDAHADYLQAELFYMQTDYETAEIFFRRVLDSSQSPDDLKRRAYISLAETYRDHARLLETDQAVEYETKLISLIDEAQKKEDMGSNTVLWEMKGKAYSERSQYTGSNDDLVKAAESYKQVLKIGIKKQQLYVNVFACYANAEKYEEAAAILDEYEKAWPQSFEPHAYRALIIAKMQEGKENPDYSGVKEEYEKAKSLVKSTDNAELLSQLESLMDDLSANGY